MGLMFLGGVTFVLFIRVVIIAILIYHRENTLTPNPQAMKRLVYVNHGLSFVALAIFSNFLFFLTLPLFVIALVFSVCTVLILLNIWIWERKLRKWFS